MKNISLRIGIVGSIILIVSGFIVQLNNSSIIGGGITGSSYNRDGFDISLSGISLIVVGFLMLFMTYLTYKDLKKRK